jgi:catechol 2,3-dioxygenase-like lactoylglutathione lyase family enzyme
MILATRHAGIVVQDMQKSLHFWRDVMGLKVTADFRAEDKYIETLQHLEGVKLHMIKLTAPDGSMIELLRDSGNPTPPPERNQLCDRGIRHLAFTVADAESAFQQLHKAGCETLSSPVTAPDGKARLFFARDPEGNLIEIVEVLFR